MFVYFLALVFMTACQHEDPNEVVHINTNITSLGAIGQGEVGVQDGKVVLLTQKELDDKLRELLWINTQTVFELKNSLPNLKLCLRKNKDNIDFNYFPKLNDFFIYDFEKSQNKLARVGINSKGHYRLIAKEGYYDILTEQQNFYNNLTELKRAVTEQLELCYDS